MLRLPLRVSVLPDVRLHASVMKGKSKSMMLGISILPLYREKSLVLYSYCFLFVGKSG